MSSEHYDETILPADSVPLSRLARSSRAAAPAAFGQAKWPSREITLINPNAPGASTDLTARIIAQALEKRLSATVIVKNVVGGAGALRLVEPGARELKAIFSV